MRCAFALVTRTPCPGRLRVLCRPCLGTCTCTNEKRLSVVMPAYDGEEEDTIAEIVGMVLASPCTAELLIIDNASTQWPTRSNA